MLQDVAFDPDARRRFLDEAKIASQLHHPNIVGVLDVGVLDGLPFHVLELVDGLDAEQLMQRLGGTLPVEVALFLANEVAHALAHAHAARDEHDVLLELVHRDVKPSNILLSWDGDVKLGDFGIALARGREARTQAGMVNGTLGFMSPEQRMRGQVDGRSDVYALGLSLHAMIAGGSPGEGPEAALLSNEPIVLAEAIPDDVRPLLAGALAPSRLDRPTSRELAESIGRVLAKRMTSDGRTIVRDLMSSLREQGGARGGVLDQLFGFEVVPLAHEPEAEAPRFEVRQAQTLVRPPERVPPPRRARAWVVVAAVVAGGGALAGWRLAGERSTAPSQLIAVAVDARRDGPSIVAEVIDAGVDRAIEVDAGTRPSDAPVRHAVLHDARAPLATPVVPVRSEGLGYIQITGEDVIGTKVLVDGRIAGYPPNKIEVARGHHTIELESRGGVRSCAREIEVTDLETLAHPLRLSCATTAHPP